MTGPPFRNRGKSLTLAQHVAQVYIREPHHSHRGRLDDRDRAAAESTTTTRSPGTGSGSFACSYSATSPVVVVFSPAKIAATSRSRNGPGKANSITGKSSVGMAARLQTRDRLKIRSVRDMTGRVD
jgi:hypothetical protein